MTDLTTISVNGVNPAVQLVMADDGPTLIGNNDITTTLWIGRSVSIIAGRPQDTIAISPQSWIVVDGKEDIYGITTGAIISVNLIPGGLSFFQSGITGGGFVANQSGAFFYVGKPGPATLICAITGTTSPGFDQYGNEYTPGGMCIIAQPAATSLFSVLDNSVPANLLASIGGDGSFSTEGTLSATTDITVAGSSIVNDIIDPLPLGSVARTFPPSGNIPTAAFASETSLYELDVDLLGGRAYMVVLEGQEYTLGAIGQRARAQVYLTTDGSTPTTGSGRFMAAFTDAQFSATVTMPACIRVTQPAVDATYRFLVTVSPSGTASMISPGTSPWGGGTNGLTIIDLGDNVPNTGIWIGTGTGGGTPPKTYTKTYTSNGSHCYQGSDGTNSNLKINDNGRAVQGGDRANTYNGAAKTWYAFPTGTMVADLAGASINWCKIYLNNNHSWYGSGMTACIGWDNKSSFGSTEGDPASAGIDIYENHFNEGQAKWMTVQNSFATNFRDGNAKQIVLWRNSNNLAYYGYFSGNTGCKIQINYTK